jgi:hypothetical protein
MPPANNQNNEQKDRDASEETVAGVSFAKPTLAPNSQEEQSPNLNEMNEDLKRAGVTTEGNGEAPAPSKAEEEILKPLRTYESDVATALKGSGGSKAALKSAEEERERRRRAKEKEAREAGLREQEEARKLKKREEEVKRQEPEQRREAERRAAQQAQRANARQTNAKENAEQEQAPGEKWRIEEEKRRAAEKERYRDIEKRVQAETHIEQEKERIRQEQERLARAQGEREVERREEEARADIRAREERKRTLSSLSVMLLFLLAGGGALYAAYVFFIAEHISGPRLQIDTLIFAETTETVPWNPTGNSALIELLAEKKRTLQTSRGDVVHFHIASPNPVQAEESAQEEEPAHAVIGALGENAPSTLARSVEDTYMVGVYAGEENGAFIVTKPTFYENAFSAMLAWEKNMAEDLSPFFAIPENIGRVPEGEIPTLFLFEDEIVLNRDTRVLKDIRGNIVLLYSFIDRNTLLITDNEPTFRELLERMSAKRISP